MRPPDGASQSAGNGLPRLRRGGPAAEVLGAELVPVGGAVVVLATAAVKRRGAVLVRAVVDDAEAGVARLPLHLLLGAAPLVAAPEVAPAYNAPRPSSSIHSNQIRSKVFHKVLASRPDFLDVLDELLAVLLPLVPILRHHQRLTSCLLRPSCLLILLVAMMTSLTSSAPSANQYIEI